MVNSAALAALVLAGGLGLGVVLLAGGEGGEPYQGMPDGSWRCQIVREDVGWVELRTTGAGRHRHSWEFLEAFGKDGQRVQVEPQGSAAGEVKLGDHFRVFVAPREVFNVTIEYAGIPFWYGGGWLPDDGDGQPR